MHTNVKKNNTSSETVLKIQKIIENEFSREIDTKRKEIFEIYKNLNKATKYLHYLRYSIVNNYYTRPELYDEEVISLSKQTRIHPALVYSAGEELVFPKSCPNINLSRNYNNLNLDSKRKNEFDDNYEVKKKKSEFFDSTDNLSLKGTARKVKKKILIKNISQWIPEDFRENEATHKWIIFIIDDETKKVPQFISKVRYFLHDSYKPHNVVEVTSAPFHLSRLGWGEFPIRVQLHFINKFDRSVDLIHNLKLDTTYTGLPTLGAETFVDLWIHTFDFLPTEESSIENNNLKNKKENILNNISKVSSNESSLDFTPEKEKDKNLKISYSFINDHDYTGNFSKIYQNVSTINNIEKLLESQGYDCTKIEEKLLKFDTNEEFQNLKIGSINYQKQKLLRNENTFINFIEKNKHVFDKFKQISNVDICDVYDKKMSKYNCGMIQKEYTKNLVGLVQHAKPKNPFDMFKFIIRRMPLITDKAKDSCYRVLHPYACESFKIFTNFSVGKQRSLEQYRAKHALEILKWAGCNINDCSVKDFIIWARKYCYTPIIKPKDFSQKSILSQSEKQLRYSSTILNPIDEWFNCINDRKIQKDYANDEEIDILSITNIKEKKKEKKSPTDPSKLIEADDLSKFVHQLVKKYGFKLKNEEIIPGIFQCTASVLIAKAVEFLMEDLLRTSFSCTIDECKTDDYEIKQKNVCMALTKRNEFTYFTNQNFGSHS